MIRLLRLFSQLLFGWDTSIAIWGSLLVSALFEEPLTRWTLLVALVCAYLPDFDLVPFLLRRRSDIANGVALGHWVYGHYPLILLPLEALVVVAVSQRLHAGHERFLTVLAVVCTLGHFLHDAFAKPHGFHLLAPLTKDRRIQFPMPWTHAHPADLYHHYRLGDDLLLEKAPAADVQKMYDDCKRWTEGSENEIANRVEPVTAAQFLVFTLGVLGLMLWWP
jgi:hypothetical protein